MENPIDEKYTPHTKDAKKKAKKRKGQVSKACTNCKKLHAACDPIRPCKRCSLNGWQDSCLDVPRKKRTVLKKGPSIAPSLKDVEKPQAQIDTKQILQLLSQLTCPPAQASPSFAPVTQRAIDDIMSGVPAIDVLHNVSSGDSLDSKKPSHVITRSHSQPLNSDPLAALLSSNTLMATPSPSTSLLATASSVSAQVANKVNAENAFGGAFDFLNHQPPMQPFTTQPGPLGIFGTLDLGRHDVFGHDNLENFDYLETDFPDTGLSSHTSAKSHDGHSLQRIFALEEELKELKHEKLKIETRMAAVKMELADALRAQMSNHTAAGWHVL